VFIVYIRILLTYKMNIYNSKIDFIFIKFPFIFPVIYFLVLHLNPEYEIYIIAFTILLLAEPHFGATWPLFFDKINKEYFSNEKIIFYFGTAIIAVTSLIGFFLYKNLFLLIFFAFNIYHVTRQSVGIAKLYNTNIKEFFFQKNCLYCFNLLFFIIGYLRFYNNVIDPSHKSTLIIFIISIILIFIMIEFIKYKSFLNSLTTFTGIMIFFPISFVDNPVHAILMGVTMHYSQYIFITTKVNFGRKNLLYILKNLEFFKFLKSNFFITIFLYSLLMGIFSLSPKIVNIDTLKNLIVIPIVGQMLHFYLDGFIWKFSEPHNREATLKYLKM
jgi:hypothetical protein